MGPEDLALVGAAKLLGAAKAAGKAKKAFDATDGITDAGKVLESGADVGRLGASDDLVRATQLTPVEVERLGTTMAAAKGPKPYHELSSAVRQAEIKYLDRAPIRKESFTDAAGNAYHEVVDLPNGHQFRRGKDGKWCRFSPGTAEVCLLPSGAGAKVGEGTLRWEAPDGRVFTDEKAYREYVKSGAATRKALPAAERGGHVRFESNVDLHLSTRDMSVPRKRGIGGAHNLDAFSDAVADMGAKVVSATPDPSLAGVQRIEYQIPALDRAGNRTGGFKSEVFKKTVYDPATIPDEEIARWGRQAAAEAQANGRLAREWTCTAPNGVRFRGYLSKTGAVRSYFPDF